MTVHQVNLKDATVPNARHRWMEVIHQPCDPEGE